VQDCSCMRGFEVLTGKDVCFVLIQSLKKAEIKLSIWFICMYRYSSVSLCCRRCC